MPIYAPTLPPRPEPGQGQQPARVMFRFRDLLEQNAKAMSAIITADRPLSEDR